jgi:hypothetical protein
MMAMWPETNVWKMEFPHLERNAYLAYFGMARNAFAHEYASQKASRILYLSLFSPHMKGRYAALMMDVARAINIFKVASRTQKVWGTVS